MYEINISAEYIDMDFFETMDTLLHEMIHLYHKVNNIQDTSRNNTYHNSKFRDKALTLGFEYASDKPNPKHGWTYARLGQKAIEEIAKFDIDQSKFVIARKGSQYFKQVVQLLQQEVTGESTSDESPPLDFDNLEATPTGRETIDIMERKPSSYKWSCPNCKVSVRSTRKQVHIICGDCNNTLEKLTP